MSNQVTLPRLGQGMESGTIVRWLKSEGDQVEKGEPLYELDTEKVTQEVEADSSGVLLKILAGEGEEIEVGKAIAVIGEEGEDVPDAEPEAAAEEEEEEEKKKKKEEAPAEPAAESENGRPEEADAPTAAEPQVSEPAGGDGGRVKASPLARRIARERGIDLRSLRGTGPEGRIVAEDVERAEAAPAPAAVTAAEPAGEAEVIPLTGMRKTIARRMTEAWQAPAFQITMTADMSAAIRLREALVARMAEGGAKPTYSDILTKVCAVALMRHRAVNALFAGDEIHLQPTANVGIAVAIPNGLVVPVLRSCETKTIPQLAAERTDIVARTRENKLKQEDLEGGTFTISNLGMFGVERFVAVLNPPQAAILAVGAIEERAVVRDGELAARPVMEMTLSCDHRSVDGATASEFLRTVKQFLEEPGLAL
jgi:pyruvate dehydrogenase E2 component (dihydrolipoamide acetyltransferase)